MGQVGLACTQLTSLKARSCPGLTLNAMQGFPELRHLDLTGCDCIAPATAVRNVIMGALAIVRWRTMGCTQLFGRVVYEPVSLESTEEVLSTDDALNTTLTHSCASTWPGSIHACVMLASKQPRSSLWC